MNTGQMMLTLGAIMVFGILILRMNTHTANISEEVDDTRFGIMALALARSRIDNAMGLKFDAQTVYSNVSADVNGKPVSGSLTSASGLGPASGETVDKFNDFDDYNGYSVDVDTIPSAIFTVASRVTYVDPANNYQPSTSLQWHKMITVTVTSPNLTNPIIMRAINSYWTY